MKNSNTVRTMRRHGIPASMSFVGAIAPSGKRVVHLAKFMRAQRRVFAALGNDAAAESHEFWGNLGQSYAQTVRMLSRGIRGSK